jgi:hypothetical protein
VAHKTVDENQNVGSVLNYSIFLLIYFWLYKMLILLALFTVYARDLLNTTTTRGGGGGCSGRGPFDAAESLGMWR